MQSIKGKEKHHDTTNSNEVTGIKIAEIDLDKTKGFR